LLDIGIPGGGIQTARSIASSCPAIKIVVLTVSDDEENLNGLLKEKYIAQSESYEPITALMDLTEREYQILRQVATGASNKEIAEVLSLSEKTVKHYMTNILQKLQVRNRVEAALIAQRARFEKLKH
jgi:two-component system, NarL family, nitrate/nitrite response regulator NarL